MSKHNSDPLLESNPNRYVLFPLSDQTIWQMYKKQVDCFWRVEEVDLSKDLTHWNSLYLSGRLHKPVNTFIASRTLMKYQERNLEAAFNAALLLTSKVFSVPELLKVICSLSYLGDIRLGFAEDSKKVERIVHGTNYYLEFAKEKKIP